MLINEWVWLRSHILLDPTYERGSGDIRLIPQASLTLITFWREISFHQSHCRKHNLWEQHQKVLATLAWWHSTFVAGKLVLNYAYSKLWIFNEAQGVIWMSPDPLLVGMRLWYGGRKFAATALVCWAIHKIYNTCQLIKSLSINFSSALVLDYFSDHILGPSSLINSSHYLPTLIFSPLPLDLFAHIDDMKQASIARTQVCTMSMYMH